ncbi:unnamed protein product [Peniophora sp. CBMAI 1063]|nr:unnamed protein product [Peniophora sp. CBMAI 1063]
MRPTPALALFTLAATSGTHSYEVPFVYGDKSTQACSGMWAGRKTFINVTLDERHSTGQLEMLIFEATDAQYIGRPHLSTVSSRTYFCNPWDIKGGVCTEQERGHFLFDLPSDLSLANTSIRTSRLKFSSAKYHFSGSPDPVFDELDQTMYDQPGQSPLLEPLVSQEIPSPPLPIPEIEYSYPVQYPVLETGYYCVAYRPVLPAPPYEHPIMHSYYKGKVLFHNDFAGRLPAAEYAKLVFYAATFSLYSLAALVWGSIYWRNRKNMLPIHVSITTILGLANLYTLLMLAHFVAMNSHKRSHPSSILHLVAHVVRAAYYTLTLAVLLSISHGLKSVGGDGNFNLFAKICISCLSVLHLVFGTLYAYGMILVLEYYVNGLILKKFKDFLVPLEVATAVFVIWFIYSWTVTLKRMTSRTQRAVRQKITLTGCTFILALVLYLALHVYFFYRSNRGMAHQHTEADEWQRVWLVDGPAAGWRELVYMPALLITLYIWRPSEAKYMYKEVPQTEDAVAAEDEAHPDGVLVGGEDSGV